LHFGFEIRIANVCSPDIEIVEFGQEDKESDAAKGDNTRVDAIKWDLSEVSISNKPTLMASIMLHIKDKVNTNLLVTLGWLASFAHVLEGPVLVELGHLKGSRVLPLSVPIALVKLDGMVIFAWDFVAILVAWHHAI